MRDINYESLQVDGIDFETYPDFENASICGGFTEDGWELTDIEMEILSTDRYLIKSLVNWRIYG